MIIDKNLNIAVGLAAGSLIFAIVLYFYQQKRLKTLLIFIPFLVYWATIIEWNLELILSVVSGVLIGYIIERYINKMMYIPVYTIIEFIVMEIEILISREGNFYVFKVYMGEECQALYFSWDGYEIFIFVTDQAEYYDLSMDSLIFWLNPIVTLGFIVYYLVIYYAVPPFSILICDVHLRILSFIGLCFWDGILPETFDLLVMTLVSGPLFCLTIVTCQLMMPYVKRLIDNRYEILLFFIASICIVILVEILFLAPKDVRLFVMISVLFVILIVILKETFFDSGKRKKK